MSVFIENSCHGLGSKTRDEIEDADVVLGTDHVVLLANGFPEIDCLRASAIFVSGTSGITAILKYRSVRLYKPYIEHSQRFIFNFLIYSICG